MSKVQIALVFFVYFFSYEAFSAGGESRHFNIRVNPFIIAIGGNIDLDYYIHSNLTVGPSYHGWGGCGPRQTGSDAPDGTQCNTWSAFGVRSNYYFDMWKSPHLIYVSPGIYQTKKAISYRYNSQNLKGDISGITATVFTGYSYQYNNSLNVNAGIGGLYFLNKKSDLTVSNSNGVQTTISSGPTTQILLEAALGWKF